MLSTQAMYHLNIPVAGIQSFHRSLYRQLSAKSRLVNILKYLTIVKVFRLLLTMYWSTTTRELAITTAKFSRQRLPQWKTPNILSSEFHWDPLRLFYRLRIFFWPRHVKFHHANAYVGRSYFMFQWCLWRFFALRDDRFIWQLTRDKSVF